MIFEKICLRNWCLIFFWPKICFSVCHLWHLLKIIHTGISKYVSILRLRFSELICLNLNRRFLRELKRLKVTADYSSCDPSKLDEWLLELGSDYSQYTYQMLQSGVDKRMLRFIHDGHLRDDCGITNGVHRIRILETAKSNSNLICLTEVFILVFTYG